MIFESLRTSVLVAAVVPQAQDTIVQKTSGWCSPVIANVVGNVTVNCIGVDPRALKRLNEQFSTMKLDSDKALQAADEWTTRYKELETRLSDAGDDAGLSLQAEEYLHAGELEKAGMILDQILGKEEKQIDRSAADQYNRALVFELQFRPLQALPHLEKAFQYRPEEPKYGHQVCEFAARPKRFQERRGCPLDNSKKCAPTSASPSRRLQAQSRDDAE